MEMPVRFGRRAALAGLVDEITAAGVGADGSMESAIPT
jgi:hypothetical protein